MPIDAILFDKDGTLFDFSATWSATTRQVIRDLSGNDPALAGVLAGVAGFDLQTGNFAPDSILIAWSNREIAEELVLVLPGRNVAEIEQQMIVAATGATLVPAVPLPEFLDDLAARGLALGVMTNDAETSARHHLHSAGVLDRFAFIAGFDSGHGAKPAPDPLLAFCRAVGAAPARAAMVGDSTHDLVAGRAAGMITIGVLTGVADTAELTPHADVVLPDIGHIPGWLAR
ncbi:MAG: phosphoglycolate phosphatase [Paracoccaceae bacterium]|jgi:phosphoglycolate phosphatase